jgi:phospholipid-transporting ATPase
MVWLMRKHKCTTLSVGDGANDVNMINTAHVGVGIKGVEGAQAALCSDYAISEFQILRELMLYHGRECYRKNSQLILFNFYKNLLLCLPQFWYGLLNNYSSATIYDPWVYQLYNVAFTSLPIMIYAIFDQQHSVAKSLKEPQLYMVGLKNQLFNVKSIVFWFATAAVYALLLMSICVFSEQLRPNQNGLMLDFMASGMTIFACAAIIANLKIFILSYTISVGLVLFASLSILFVYIVYALSELFLPLG